MSRFSYKWNPIHAVLLWAIILSLSFSASGAPLKPINPIFIENDQVQIGVDLGSGGGIFYFSEKSPERNLLNHFDKGRFIQQSYYGDPDGSFWNHHPWRWNPVQGGGWNGEPAKVLDSSFTPEKIYVRTEPKLWATGQDTPTAVMEEWLDLQGNVGHIHFKFTYTGQENYAPRSQELPAVFMDYALNNLVFYSDPHPWSNAALTRKVPGFPNQPAQADENWAAYVDDRDWGLGVYFPGSTRLTTYRAKANLTTGSTGAACSYFAPIQKLAITQGFSHEYDVYLVIGKIPEIRSAFYSLHSKLLVSAGTASR